MDLELDETVLYDQAGIINFLIFFSSNNLKFIISIEKFNFQF